MSLAPKFYYGSWTSEHGEVSPIVVRSQPIWSETNARFVTKYTFQLHGDLIFPDQADADVTPEMVAAKVNTVNAAFLYDFQDFGFYVYDENGTPTGVHECENLDPYNLSGNRIEQVTWGNDAESMEMSNTRSFDIVLSAVFESAYRNLIDGHEVLEFVGSGGPEYQWTKKFNGTWVRQQVVSDTYQYVVQRGYVMYLRDFGPVPSPNLALAAYEDEPRRRIVKHKPIFMGNYNAPQYRMYRYDYEFTFKLPPNVAINPQLWI